MRERRVILCVDAAVATGDDAARATIRAALRDLDDANVSTTTTYDEIDALVVAPREPTCDVFYVAVADGEGATRAGAAAREALRPGGTCAVRVDAPWHTASAPTCFAISICLLAMSGSAMDVPSKYVPSYNAFARNIGNT